MKDKKKLIIAIIAAVIVIAGGIGAYFYFDSKKDKKEEESEEKIVITEDEKKFKEEYESLNGKKNDADVPYKEIEIPEDNNVKYLTDEEAAKFLKEGTGVIYFGFNDCPWCRNLIPVLLNASDNVGIDEIYYTNIKEIRSTFKVKNNKAKEEKKGTDAYYEILKSLDKYLSDYTIKNSKGKKIKTGEKRLYAPTVVVVKDGEVVAVHEDTVKGHVKVDGVLPDLTEEQTKELYLILEEMLAQISDSNCDEGC